MSNGAAIVQTEEVIQPALKLLIDKPGHYGSLTPDQERKLAEYEKKLTGIGALPDPLLANEAQRATVLLRYLRARDWSIEHATKMYSDCLQWRREVDLAGMMKARAEGKDTFEERPIVAKLGWKMYFHKTDRFNRPIFVQDLSDLQINEVFNHTTPERIVNFFAVSLEEAVRNKYAICTDLTKKQAQEQNLATPEEIKKILIDDNFMIINAAGLGMATFWSFKGQLQKLLGILDANYPELSGRIQIINAPWLFATIFSYVKVWLPKNTVGKIGIAGTEFQSELFEYVDPANLPISLGGTCQCSCEGGCAFSDAGPWQDEMKGDNKVEEKVKEAKVEVEPVKAAAPIAEPNSTLTSTDNIGS